METSLAIVTSLELILDKLFILFRGSSVKNIFIKFGFLKKIMFSIIVEATSYWGEKVKVIH